MRTSIVLLLVIITSAVTAQKFSVETIGQIKDKKSFSDIVLFDNRFYGLETAASSKFGWTATLDKMKSSCKLLVFDNKLNLTKEVPLADGKEVFGPFSPFYKAINNKLCLIYYKYDSKNGIEIYSSVVDPVTAALSDAKKILTMSQKNIGLFKMMDLYSSYDLLIETSADKSKNFFFWTSGVNNACSYSVTDNEMNVIRSGNYEIENVKEFTISNVLVDNAGNFFVGCLYLKKEVFLPYLLSGLSGSSMKTTELQMESVKAHSIYIAPGTDETKLKLYGTSSQDGEYITGAYSLFIDKKSLKISNPLVKEVPPELVEKFDDDSYAVTKKKSYGLHPYVQFDNITLSDGTLMLAGDLTRFQNVGADRPSAPVKGSSLIIIFKPASDILIKRLPKKEVLGQKTGSSFFAHKRSDNLILLYTDRESNINIPIDDAKCTQFSTGKDNVLVAATIEKDGRITRRILNPATTSSFYFSAGTTSSVDNNTMLLGLGKDKLRLTSIKSTYAFYFLKITED